MSSVYCLHSDVSTFFGWPAFTTGTTITIAKVDAMINANEDFIDQETEHAWRAVTVTNEFHDHPGVYERDAGVPFYLNHRSLRTLTTSTDKIEIWNGSTYDDYVATKTNNRNGDFWTDDQNGVIYLKTISSFSKKRVMRATYRYGESAVPNDIKQAAVLLTAYNLMSSDETASYAANVETGISKASRMEEYKKRAMEIIENHRELHLGGM